MSSYSTFNLSRSVLQLRHALRERSKAAINAAALLSIVQCDEKIMADCLGRPIENLRILEIGPGQGMERASYFGLKNQVIGIDLDVIPVGFHIAQYFQVIRKNGFGRLSKTIARKMVLGNANTSAWAKTIGVKRLTYPSMIHGDFCQPISGIDSFHLIMSWSVFEHLTDPSAALHNSVCLLNPGGLLFISIHLYTSNNGHHDIRSFSGLAEEVPLWGHLRASTRHLVKPSAYLNAWRLEQWRELFQQLTPGYREYRHEYEHRERFGSRLTPQIREEVAGYHEQELFTVDLVFVWRKPEVDVRVL